MGSETVVRKLIGIGIITVLCYIASLMVLGLVQERQQRHDTVAEEISATWGAAQTITGPILVFTIPPATAKDVARTRYVLPNTLKIESTLAPEVRSRGIYDTIVYTEKVRMSGTFRTSDAEGALPLRATPLLAVGLSDTRSIEKQVTLTWNGDVQPFAPGSGTTLLEGAGIHAQVPYLSTVSEYPFSFEFEIQGARSALFVPVGKETEVVASSTFGTPEFTGAFLPQERTVTKDGFTASWKVSSFGRTYPQTWEGGSVVSLTDFTNSAFGINFYPGVDLYTQLERSVKYAIIFIVVTFTVFFLFETLSAVRVHPIQYLLVGAALALFYLLLVSFAEHVGFVRAYALATTLITVLVSGYSASVLKQRGRALLIAVQLLVLYAYLYFVLKLEDYALLFGSVLLFVLLAGVMFLTRRIDWFAGTQ
jgi:inner membrane protein